MGAVFILTRVQIEFLCAFCAIRESSQSLTPQRKITAAPAKFAR
jgi:hypothetical protein